ncbi:hypothetical protein [Methylobacterium sp. JK268]
MSGHSRAGWARRAGLLAAGVLLLAVQGAAAERAKPAPKPAPPVVACLSLANLRILLRETNGDPAAVAGRFADPKSDHLNCAMTPADRVEGVADRVTIGGTPYQCLRIKDSSVCRWAEAR